MSSIVQTCFWYSLFERLWSYRLLAHATDWIVPAGYSQGTVVDTSTTDQLAEYLDLIADQKDATMADWYRRKAMVQLGRGLSHYDYHPTKFST